MGVGISQERTKRAYCSKKTSTTGTETPLIVIVDLQVLDKELTKYSIPSTARIA